MTFSLDHVLLACLVFLGANASLPEAGSSLSAAGGHRDGDNLLDPSAPLAAAKPTLTVDWPKSPVGRTRFHGYTSSGRSLLFGSGGFQPVHKGLGPARPSLLQHFLSIGKSLGSSCLSCLGMSLRGPQAEAPHQRQNGPL